MSYDILREDIKNNKIKNLYLFYGPEEFLIKHSIKNIEEKLLKDDMGSINKIILDGKLNISDFIDICETFPVFSDRKIVVVKNSGVFKSAGKSVTKAKSKVNKDELVEYLKNIPEHTCIIFCENEIDKRLSSINVIKERGLLVEFTYRTPIELAKWIIKGFESHSKQMDERAAARMVEICEPGMTDIKNEIDKLVLYLGDKKKTSIEEIEKICTKSVKCIIFDLTNAITEKNTEKALKIFNDLLILKEPVLKIMPMITRQLRQILIAKTMYAKGLQADRISAKLKIMPFTASKIIKQTANFSEIGIKAFFEECLNLNNEIKLGKIDEKIAVEVLITKITSKIV